ncbi:MAG: diaminopimelate epimerase [Candidatus Lokiarchaeota archaeon]|nr:diaminopimelate epimerase [Candidatus Lokiarchaeota archaeon]
MSDLNLENISFEKYHGLGNDYILLNDIELAIPEEKKGELAKQLCRFHFSIGADGVIFVCSSKKADIKMRIFNADGSEAEMCGNGIRCFSKHIYERNIVKKDLIQVETLKIVTIAELNVRDGEVKTVKIDMGPPILECDKIPVKTNKNTGKCLNEEIAVLDKIFNFSAVSMGNPHAVIFVKKQLTNDELNRYGNLIESHHYFPNKINVEFVTIKSKTEANLRVFERGVGITNSCGTGTCAAVVAGTILGIFEKKAPVIVHNDGGVLIITYTGKTVYMEGPVERVFVGTIEKLTI